jgi:hypothetical protein
VPFASQEPLACVGITPTRSGGGPIRRCPNRLSRRQTDLVPTPPGVNGLILGYPTTMSFDPERRLFGLTMRWVLLALAAIILVVVLIWVIVRIV